MGAQAQNNACELLNEAWTLPPPETPPGAVAMEVFRASGLGYPRATVVGTPSDSADEPPWHGTFLTIFPTSALSFPTKRPEIKVLPVDLPVANLPIGVVTLKSRTLSPVALLFIDAARDIAKPITRKNSDGLSLHLEPGCFHDRQPLAHLGGEQVGKILR